MATMIRPGDGSDNRYYSPHRDLAHCGIPMLRKVFGLLGEEYWTAWMQSFARDNGLSEESLCRVAAAVARFVDLVPNPTVADVEAAWRDSGLALIEDVSPESLHLFWVVLGRMTLLAIFNGMRDTTPLGDKSVGRDVDRLLAQADAVIARAAAPRYVRWALRRIPPLGRWLMRRYSGRGV